MELQDRKCVMILNEELPAGVLANTAGILGITLGKKVPENIGPDIYDKDGREHLGIVLYPDDTIQHAGVGFGIGGVAGHLHKYYPASSDGYMGRQIGRAHV